MHGRKIVSTETARFPATFAGLSLALLLATVPSRARADPEQAVASESTTDHIVVGAGAAIVPTYEGSNSTRVLPWPAIDIKEGIFTADEVNGAGVSWPASGPISIGASIIFVRGYRRRDVPVGIDHVSNTAGARIRATIRQWGFIGTVGVTKPIGGAKGLTGDILISHPVPVSPKLVMIPSISTTWANDKYNDRYFGVSPEEALNSGLPRFHVGGGFKDVTLGLGLNYRLTRHWAVSAGAGVTWLIGDARNSPFVQQTTNGQGYAALSYRF